MPKSKILARNVLIGHEFTSNRKRSVAFIEAHHSEKFGKKIDWTGNWICDSTDNDGIYCVYDRAEDPLMDDCCYCGQPNERK